MSVPVGTTEAPGRVVFAHDGYCSTCRVRIAALDREPSCATCGTVVVTATPLRLPNKRRRAAVKVAARRAVNVARALLGWTPPGGSIVRRLTRKGVVSYACETINRSFAADTKGMSAQIRAAIAERKAAQKAQRAMATKDGVAS